MKSYTVKQISEILNTNPETVRRWIRDKKLTAVQSSRKGGNVISEEALNQFLAESPKYAGIATGMLAILPIIGMGLYPVIAGLIGAKMAYDNRKPNQGISEDELKQYLAEIVMDSENKIKRAESRIKKLQEEIKEEERRIQEVNAIRDNIDSGNNFPHSVSLPEASNG